MNQLYKSYLDEAVRTNYDGNTFYSCYVGFNIDGTTEEKITRLDAMELPKCLEAYAESRAENKMRLPSINGGLLFLGIFLGSMFLMVAVMIIFYKQITEG